MTTDSQDFFERCEAIRPLARRTWGTAPFGWRSDRGPILAATEATGQADYATGDDFRNVDWQRAARLDELVSRQYRGVETGTVTLLIDRSQSMSIGTPSKLEMAQQLASALGYFALRAGRSVTAHSNTYHGRGAAVTMNEGLAQQRVGAEPNELFDNARLVARQLRRGDAAVVLSDLLISDGIELLLASFARPSEQLVIIQILAAEDLEPTCQGFARLHDVETGRDLDMQLEESDLTIYREAAAEFCQRVRRTCAAGRVTLVQVRSDAGFDRCLQQVIHLTSLASRRC